MTSVDRRPIGPVGQHLWARGVTLQVIGPTVIRVRFRAEIDFLASKLLAISPLEVFQEDSPGDAIDHQVMDDQQEPIVVPQSEEDGVHQRPAREVEAAVDLIGGAFECLIRVR